jgi:copper chaperone CopZ
MDKVFEITGMSCSGCVARVARALQQLDPGVSVTLEPPHARFPSAAPSLDAVAAALQAAGKYTAKPA